MSGTGPSDPKPPALGEKDRMIARDIIAIVSERRRADIGGAVIRALEGAGFQIVRTDV